MSGVVTAVIIRTERIKIEKCCAVAFCNYVANDFLWLHNKANGADNNANNWNLYKDSEKSYLYKKHLISSLTYHFFVLLGP